MQSKEHWENVYSTKATDAVSWFQEHAENSLKLIQKTGVSLSSAIIDIGGGASTYLILALAMTALSGCASKIDRTSDGSLSVANFTQNATVAQNCDCTKNFEWVKQTFEGNDAGFEYVSLIFI
jgi:hypothetical protein